MTFSLNEKSLLGLALLFGTLCIGHGFGDNNRTSGSVRQGKLFSLFNVVNFKNGPCPSSSSIGSGNSGRRNGTCYTAAECATRGGSASGNCAAGFGVCCVFYLNAGQTTSQNCTYIRNDNFPGTLQTTNAQSFTIQKCSCDVCYLRLDFLTFTIRGQVDSEEIMGGVCGDSFKVTSGSNEPHPTICGENSGQHMYVDMGRGCSGTALLDFSFTDASSIRLFEIKATQVECNSRSSPPDGCLQYHTDLQGRFTTFNFAPTDNNHLGDQNYGICVRQELGYCCIEYQVCPEVLDTGFTIGNKGDDKGYTDSDCATLDFVGIEGSATTCGQAGAPSARSTRSIAAPS
ncbi:uncharacterized protein LOC131879360 [Tigriopus californicus]|uniref:uncharacterized protein LOC131879360 n=1 Tax=Tigriopus californicus TaxID=6832 RepID=UPI0027DA8139|nr:uncharacterized protein LOC131879360 [Tigriopus californicus]